MAAANTVIATLTDHSATEVAIGNRTGARRQRKLSFFGIAAFAATVAAGLSAQGTALGAPMNPQGAVLTPAAFAPYMFGGRQYCWYGSAWSGPGWYWCGYAWRDGLGWGGPRGWHGWHGGGRADGHGGVSRLGGAGDHFGGAMGHAGGGAHFAASSGGGHIGGGTGHTGGFGGGHATGFAGGGHMGGGGGGHMGGGGGGGHMGGGGGGHAGGGGGGHR